MRPSLVLACAAALASGASLTSTRAPVLEDALIAEVNDNPESTWQAGRNDRFEGMSVDEARAMLGSRSPPMRRARSADHPKEEQKEDVGRIPLNFDARTQWPDCIHPVRDQGACGGCWAFGASEVLSDRFCIASNGAVNVTLSPQDLLSCDVGKYTMGCDGGVPEYAWKYLETTGISTDACIPYVANNTACPSVCADGTPNKKYKAKEGSVKLLDGAASAAQQYIVQGGPIQADFDVYQDFFSYKSGIYQHTNQSQTVLGRHSIKVVGYGVDAGVAYWTVANSWGPDWGMDGYFNIVRSNPRDCRIEDEMILGDPAI